jgi:hypothetical protein
MNTPKDPNASDSHQPVNEQRRRLAKGSLAAPIVIGALMSRPVLGADTPHNCTISGQMSGNVSTHVQGTCSLLGRNAAYWISLWMSGNQPTWPNSGDFYKSSRKKLAGARDFGDTPNSKAQFTGSPFQAVLSSDPTKTRNATVLEVLLGGIPNYGPADYAYSGTDSAFTLTSSRPDRFDNALGREVVVAYLNATEGAMGYPAFPISPAEVVAMFNSIAKTGTCTVGTGVTWNGSKLLTYLTQLHS